MKFSKQSTYGMRAMIQLAKCWNEDTNDRMSLSEISEKEQISKKYLEQIFIKFKEFELVGADKGSRGGYFLLRKPIDIRIFDIVEALEGGVRPADCVSSEGELLCGKGSSCGVVSLLREIQKETTKVLKKMTLQDIAKKHK
jgi:Rrf2 family protein